MSTRTRSKLLVAKDRAELRTLAADVIARKIHEHARRGVCSVALSGGSTPGPVYEELSTGPASERIPWAQVEWYFADERAVPLDHPDSNYQLVRKTLFKAHPEALGQCYRMPADAPDPDVAADRYGRRLPDPVDVLILGMGPDGHIASLFPGSSAIDEKERRVVSVDDSPKPPARRMTITPVVIQRARSVVVLVSGVEKAAMVARALGGFVDPKILPAQLVKRATWVCDQAAASNMLMP